MMVELHKIILFLFIFPITIIIVIKFGKDGRTFKEATQIIIHAMKDIISGLKEPKQIDILFPVYIGYNGYDIIPNNVENAFAELSNYFEVFYYDYYVNKQNRIIYIFKIAHIKSDFEYIFFIELIQKIIERILVRHFRAQDFYMPCDNLVSIKIEGDVLYVSIAKNNLGIIETKNYRRKIKNDYYTEKFSEKDNEIHADWDESKRALE